MKHLAWIALAAGLALVSAGTVADPAVKVYMDRESAGWAYKNSDYAFVIEQQGCRIQWNAEEGKDGIRRLLVRRDCKVGFMEQIPLHRAILKAISQQWPLPSFKSMAWTSLCYGQDIGQCAPIIRASLQSADYIDYYRHYPHSRLKGINSLFVQLANSTQSYAPLAALLREFGADVRLASVEKVFESRLADTPFAEALKPLALGKSPKAKVMVDAGFWYFDLTDSGRSP